MKINRAFKFRIYPNETQRQMLEKHFGCVRFVYNHFLRQRIDHYEETGKGLTYYDNASTLGDMKRQPEYEWLKEVNSQSLQQSLRNLHTAYINFFRQRARFPTFKRKSHKQSFCVPQHFSIQALTSPHTRGSDQNDLDSALGFAESEDTDLGRAQRREANTRNTLRIPKCTPIRIVLHRKIEGTMKSVTISKTRSGKYYASILCESEMPDPVYSGSEMGIDYGLKSFVTTSDTEVIDAPRFLREAEDRLRRLQRRVSRKQKGSSNRRKAIIRLARQHEKVSNQRQDFLHKASRQLVRENQAIYIESLAIKNMLKNHHLAKSIGDSGWNIFVNMLKYKGQWYGCHIIEIDRFFPSSKRCHNCGYINDTLTLSDRHWQCPECSTNHDRDLNAAINILLVGSGRSELTPVERGVPLVKPSLSRVASR